MTTVGLGSQPIETPSVSTILEASGADDLQRIHDPSVQLVLWKRQIPQGQTEWLATLPAEPWPTARLKVPLGAVEAAVEAALDARGVPPSTGRHLLVADVLLLAMLFSHVERCEWLAIRLEAIDHDACRKPHVDRVSSRLLCTYRGAGTEFGRMSDRDWRSELRLAPFEVGLVKGLLHPTLRHAGDKGLAHRSPRFSNGDPARLLLCIDRADSPSAATYH